MNAQDAIYRPDTSSSIFTNIIEQDKKKTLIISIEYPHSCHELTCPHRKA